MIRSIVFALFTILASFQAVADPVRLKCDPCVINPCTLSPERCR
jgi:hypothetical protein